MDLEFSPALTAITVFALLLAVAGNVVLGVAIWGFRAASAVGGTALDHRDAGVLRLGRLPGDGDHGRQPADPARRGPAPGGQQQRLDRVDCAPSGEEARSDRADRSAVLRPPVAGAGS